MWQKELGKAKLETLLVFSSEAQLSKDWKSSHYTLLECIRFVYSWCITKHKLVYMYYLQCHTPQIQGLITVHLYFEIDILPHLRIYLSCVMLISMLQFLD